MATEAFLLQSNGWTPNNQRYPIIVYRHALVSGEAEQTAQALEYLFKENDWPPQWRDGVFTYHHYHSTAHEVLGFAQGSAKLVLGGPGGREIRVDGGDVVLLPAGTGHFQAEASADFLVIGAYPRGQTFDICRQAPNAEASRRIDDLEPPAYDPVLGKDGPMRRLWSR